MAVRSMLDGHPQPQGVFDGEHDKRENFDQNEGERVTRAVFRDRFDRDRDQVDQDERDQQPVDRHAGAVADRALLEDLIDAAAQFVDLVAGHGTLRWNRKRY